ncbi:MAG: hypothetical protein V7703_17690, partial [Hyphomicrobiales bacterium]
QACQMMGRCQTWTFLDLVFSVQFSLLGRCHSGFMPRLANKALPGKLRVRKNQFSFASELGKQNWPM